MTRCAPVPGGLAPEAGRVRSGGHHRSRTIVATGDSEKYTVGIGRMRPDQSFEVTNLAPDRNRLRDLHQTSAVLGAGSAMLGCWVAYW